MALLSRIFMPGLHSSFRESLVCRNVFNLPCCNGTFYSAYISNRKVGSGGKIKVVEPNPRDQELRQLGYEDRNERIGRVLSPHLTIYSPQLTSMLSISQRITGMALTVYIWTLGIGALLTSHDVQHFITMIEGLEFSDTCLTVGKLIISIPVTFHYWNAIRHLLWTFGSLLNLDLVYSSGYAVLALTPLSAVGLSLL